MFHFTSWVVFRFVLCNHLVRCPHFPAVRGQAARGRARGVRQCGTGVAGGGNAGGLGDGVSRAQLVFALLGLVLALDSFGQRALQMRVLELRGGSPGASAAGAERAGVAPSRRGKDGEEGSVQGYAGKLVTVVPLLRYTRAHLGC